MLVVAAICLCIGAGVVGGVFFAFSTFVLRALADLPDDLGVRAMQRINVVVLNPLFLGVFLGTAALSVACIVVAAGAWPTAAALLLVAASLSYLLGSFGVTMAFNVPRNERLARLQPAVAARAYWPAYVREWGRWNHARTAASLAAALLAGGAAVI